MTSYFDDQVRKTIGRQIRNLRIELGLSQEELAFRVGIDRTYIGRIERGIANPKASLIYRMAYELKVEPAEIYVPIDEKPD
ncbi:helix-turn-helix domain-containing protein [Halobacillus sp. BBL2006]|uniref:helix-turn-helix domain-containing protein n=1 Tax=Halobacillus sp. BBL2006 TaxID=1543706 RepID=UPI0005439BE2|nr:helix-turn-helix transcriptional regulator [Halobacillus sp. BBL2006]KHE72644.1 hypothetical protein LD39_03505 [Halobacillus sp. BBL2006]